VNKQTVVQEIEMPMKREVSKVIKHLDIIRVILDQEQALIDFEIDLDDEEISLKEKASYSLFNDEITEIKFMQSPYVVMSSNSEILKILNYETAKYELCLGHSDLIVALDVYENFIVSGAKDNTLRLWRVEFEERLRVTCLAVFEGHTMNLTSLCIDPKKGNYVVSASLDKTIKKWNLHQHFENKETVTVNEAIGSQIAHEKVINVVRVSPGESNKVVASASHDRTIKIWKASNLEEVSVLKGHSRVIWDIAFSPFERVLASASADKTIKIWNVSSGQCINTLEGHVYPIL
jgi:U3 small nucleolar RNA-associated protein 13